jgi:hypothetical protein
VDVFLGDGHYLRGQLLYPRIELAPVTGEVLDDA